MFITDLYSRVLMEPYKSQDADCLKVLTGYATPAMAMRHLVDSDRLRYKGDSTLNPLRVDVVCGMTRFDGLPVIQHNTFLEMATKKYEGRFSCNYVVEAPAVHAKIYVWCDGDKPVRAYIGSANYTQTAIIGDQIEGMDCCDEVKALSVFEDAKSRSLECEHDDVESSIQLHEYDDPLVDSLDRVELPFLLTSGNRSGETPRRSGINWGQRPRRNRNEAYLSIPLSIRQSGFFPPRAVQFTMLTDDEFSMLCVVAQDDGKAIHTPESNAIIGKYFRRRLGLESGEFVEKSHFDAYGRADVTVYKIDDETFYLDFSLSD